MATNITTSASSFNTANMKPAANDQADALWAQNLADNTGHLFYKAQPLPISFWNGSGGNVVSGLFYKTAAHSFARVAFAANSNIGAITTTLSAFTATSDYGNYGAADSAAASTNTTHTVNADTTYTLELDISALTNGVLYYVRLSHSSSITTLHPPGFWLIHGAAATY